MKPNFMLLGAAKCGTTSLYHVLRQHPQIYLSEPKEPRFFELEYAEGMDYYWTKYFGGWDGEPVVGDASPRNLFLPYIPSRIRAELPEAKLLVILRDPVQRAFSAWWMGHSLGVEPLSFAAAIQANWEQIQSGFSFDGPEGEARWSMARHWGGAYRTVRFRWYLDMGYYAEQLERYFSFFPQEQLMVIFLRDFSSQPDVLLPELWDFLGVPEMDFSQIDLSPKMVATPQFGVSLLRIAQALNIQRLIPKHVRLFLAKALGKLGRKPTMGSETREWLVDHYRPHNRELEQLLDVELSSWMH